MYMDCRRREREKREREIAREFFSRQWRNGGFGCISATPPIVIVLIYKVVF